jgi:N-acetyltransferase 10
VGDWQGDMVPWAMLQQYRDLDFLQLSGARVVRIAVHPDLPKLGYGSRALELLRDYYQVGLPPCLIRPWPGWDLP